MLDIRDLKTTEDLKSFAKELDPEKDDDLRKFFLLQRITPYFSKYGSSFKARKNFFGERLDEATLNAKFNIKDRVIKNNYIIPRCDWKLEEAVGGYNTILNFFNKYMTPLMSHYEPTSDTLILRSCTARKPYEYTNFQKSLSSFDWAVCSYNIVPKVFNDEYPFAFYCGTEKPEGTTLWQRLDNKSQSIVNFLEAFQYKRVIDYTRPIFYETGKTVPSPLSLIRETNPNLDIDFYIYEKPYKITLQLLRYYSKEQHFKSFLEKCLNKKIN